jgi:hypothetical protein
MSLHTLHSISGLLVSIFFGSKVVLHYYLAYKNKRASNFLYSLASPVGYFGFYRKPVSQDFLKIKKLCNGLLCAALISLIANLLLGIAIYFN